MEKLKDIVPGMSVNIVADIDVDKEITEVRNAIVYDVDGANLVLSQTNPPFEEYHLDKKITVTYIVKGKDGLSRMGFSGKIVSILNDYSLYSSSVVEALNVLRKGGLTTHDLRMHYRISPRSDSGINIYVGHEQVSLIDISMGGARFCHSKDHPIESRNIIKMILEIDAQKFNIEAKKVNVWHLPEAGRRADFVYVSVQFTKLDKNCSHILSGKILSIQRELLSKHSG
ncbi:MAG: PilZ domain-containing protein [Syntrophales bacterium]